MLTFSDRFCPGMIAARSGWEIVRVFEDAGISGAKGRDGRPGLDAMLKAVNAKEFDLSTTAGKAMFQMLGVFAEFERSIIKERVNAGLARARAKRPVM
jgi:DNA invertase Pin-like site-specific DNA recombinase